jgi:DivIVA domain-containing protein
VNLVVMMAVVALILIGIAVAVANADAGMPDAPRDLPDTGIPADRPMTADDVENLKFSMAPRGYRMAEVDEAIGRLRDELAARDAEIDRLQNPPAEPAEPVEAAEVDTDNETAVIEPHA